MSMLPFKILKNLKCADCKSYLSCHPVRILRNGRGICGRCGTKKLGVTSKTYENLASAFSYPCIHRKNNCPAIMPWNQLLQHEWTCSYEPGCCLCLRHPSTLCGNTLSNSDKKGGKPIVANEEIVSLLICTICSKSLTSYPLFIAADGGDVCFDCGNLVQPPIRRNVPLEKILEAFSFPWTYGPHAQYETKGKSSKKEKPKRAPKARRSRKSDSDSASESESESEAEADSYSSISSISSIPHSIRDSSSSASSVHHGHHSHSGRSPSPPSRPSPSPSPPRYSPPSYPSPPSSRASYGS